MTVSVRTRQAGVNALAFDRAPYCFQTSRLPIFMFLPMMSNCYLPFLVEVSVIQQREQVQPVVTLFQAGLNMNSRIENSNSGQSNTSHTPHIAKN